MLNRELLVRKRSDHNTRREPLALAIVMPVFLDPLAGAILFVVYLAPFLLRQAAAVSLPIVVDLLIDVLLATFKIRGLPWRKLPVRNALRNSLLLICHTRFGREAVSIYCVHRGYGGPSMIKRRKLVAVLRRILQMRHLIARGLKVLLVFEGTLLRGWLRHNSAWPIETGTIVDHGCVVNHCSIDINVSHYVVLTFTTAVL